METSNREEIGPNQGQGTGATIVGQYRYLLWRTWDETGPAVLWVLLNPSTADGQADDPTLRRCRRFSREWGYGGLEVVNLFAFRATRAQDVQMVADPIGPENNRYLAAAATRATQIVVAWGERGAYQQRDRTVLALLAQHAARPLLCIGTTRNGCPRHPLYVVCSTRPVRYHSNVS